MYVGRNPPGRPPTLMLSRPILLVALAARLAAAQEPAASGATVSGVVWDSVAHATLAGAIVQLVATDSLGRFSRMTAADSSGRFTLSGIPAGRYALGFFHPMLDSLGLEPTLHAVSISGSKPVRADLAIPSPARIREAICGAQSPSSPGAVIVGTIRNARDRAPIDGAAVVGQWVEVSFASNMIAGHTQRLEATSTKNGWFSLCNVPSAGMVAISASFGADSTDLVELSMSGDGFLRRELYVGPSAIVVRTDSTRRADSVSSARGSRRTGDGRLSGTVASGLGGVPLKGAVVSILDGPQTQTNERGEWTLVGVPVGTRMLEIRAIGHFPERRPVDVLPLAPPVATTLSTMQAVLDTMRVTASRLADRRNTGFDERRRIGVGHFLTPDDIEKRRPTVTSELFRGVPGLRLERTDNAADGNLLLMRGPFDDCRPAVYIDGRFMNDLTADEIDDWVNPEEVAGIEIYAGPGLPEQFSTGLGGVGRRGAQQCGSIVIWTRPNPSLRRGSKPPVRRAMGVVAIGALVGLLLERR